jgi:Lar family restriction alleviation protein
MPDAAVDLLPCPFCGSRASHYHHMKDVYLNVVACTGCYASVSLPAKHATDDEVKAMWNRRITTAHRDNAASPTSLSG